MTFTKCFIENSFNKLVPIFLGMSKCTFFSRCAWKSQTSRLSLFQLTSASNIDAGIMNCKSQAFTWLKSQKPYI